MARYIDADAILEKAFEVEIYEYGEPKTILVVSAEDVMFVPTADVQKIRHGKWLHKRKYVTNASGEFKTFYFRICSECGKNPRIKRNRVVNYCPNCGAEMEDSDAEIH